MEYNTAKHHLTTLIMFVILLSCSSNKLYLKTDQNITEYIRFISGLNISKKSTLFNITSHSFYKDHIYMMNRFWKSLYNKNLSHIINWRNVYLKQTNVQTVLYPLSGADFINMYSFYPDADEYIMFAMEEAGNIVNPEKIDIGTLEDGFNSIYRALWTTASLNYFKSNAMRKSLDEGPFKGTLSIILMYAARLNLEILQVKKIIITNEGKISSPKQISNNPDVIHGNMILFKKPDNDTVRKIVYLKLELKKDTLKTLPTKNFFYNLNNFAVLMKSAIYLLHKKEYEPFCRYIINRSSVIIQDDSAIPYGFLKRKNMDITLFGTYSGPKKIEDLEQQNIQHDLAKDYEKNAVPITFRFGYGAWDNTSNMQLIKKK